MATVDGVKSRGRDELESIGEITDDVWKEEKIDGEGGAWMGTIGTLANSVYVRVDESNK